MARKIGWYVVTGTTLLLVLFGLGAGLYVATNAELTPGVVSPLLFFILGLFYVVASSVFPYFSPSYRQMSDVAHGAVDVEAGFLDSYKKD